MARNLQAFNKTFLKNEEILLQGRSATVLKLQSNVKEIII